ncbi:hypothetical protein ACWGJT_03890 [Streptomyces xantholiticus]
MERLTRQVLDGTIDEVTDALAEQTEDGTNDVTASSREMTSLHGAARQL